MQPTTSNTSTRPNSYREYKYTTDCQHCPFCGTQTEYVGTYPRSTHVCPSCGSRCVNRSRNRNVIRHCFRRYTPHTTPWDAMHLEDAELVTEADATRMLFWDHDDKCRQCGGVNVKLVVWRAVSGNYDSFLHCLDCDATMRVYVQAEHP